MTVFVVILAIFVLGVLFGCGGRERTDAEAAEWERRHPTTQRDYRRYRP